MDDRGGDARLNQIRIIHAHYGRVVLPRLLALVYRVVEHGEWVVLYGREFAALEGEGGRRGGHDVLPFEAHHLLNLVNEAVLSVVLRVGALFPFRL